MDPTIVDREAQPYVALRGKIAMNEIAEFARRTPDLFGWLAARTIDPVGEVFFKYDVVDMEHGLVLEIGVPVEERQHGEGEIVAGVLPAGRYASVTHIGHPDKLVDATRDLLAWGAEQGLVWDSDGDKWGCRLEVYKSDVDEDMDNWETELLFRLRG
ncbi:GyrI-like domain-containing protein [Kribbella catacumbae]|uniref:GyrI-like domain-containing protein n=1 Tax=Kribbella catacumbae TaxID=460086 RepID=UPI0003824726|nr:GyrI-like domain-containing protein [Kribbella catacumbae]